MDRKFLQRRPVLSLPQIIALGLLLVGLAFAIDLNRRAQAGRLVGMGESGLQADFAREATRQVELQATLEYVQSDDFIADYARNEGGLLQPGEQRVVPLVMEAEQQATPVPSPEEDPALRAQPWQAWWQILTDAPLPTR